MSGQTNALPFFRSKNILTSPNSFEPVQILLDRPKRFGYVKVGQKNSFETALRAVRRYENLGACCNPILFEEEGLPF